MFDWNGVPALWKFFSGKNYVSDHFIWQRPQKAIFQINSYQNHPLLNIDLKWDFIWGIHPGKLHCKCNEKLHNGRSNRILKTNRSISEISKYAFCNAKYQRYQNGPDSCLLDDRGTMTKRQCQNVSTTPITAMGCRQCLPLSVVQLKGKHCRKPHCRNGVVDTFRQSTANNTKCLETKSFENMTFEIWH
jgi:hypothetical protein